MDIKENFSHNLIIYRKAMNLTQAEFAEKINYSDKAVSKWERGESLPDLIVIKQIADLFNITIDELISKPKADKIKLKKIFKSNIFLSFLTVCIIWLIATVLYCFAGVIVPETMGKAWIFFITAIPFTFATLTPLFKRKFGDIAYCLALTLLLFSLALAVYVILMQFLHNPPASLWIIFFIPIASSTVIWFWLLYKKSKKH